MTEDAPDPELVDVIVYGYGRFGRQLVRRITAAGRKVLVVDWDPRAVAEPETAGRARVVFGDADDAEFPGSLPLQHAAWVVSTLPHLETGKVLAHALRRWGFPSKLAVTTHRDGDAARFAAELADGRVDLVINPFDDAGRAAMQQIVTDTAGPEPSEGSC